MFLATLAWDLKAFRPYTHNHDHGGLALHSLFILIRLIDTNSTHSRPGNERELPRMSRTFPSYPPHSFSPNPWPPLLYIWCFVLHTPTPPSSNLTAQTTAIHHRVAKINTTSICVRRESKMSSSIRPTKTPGLVYVALLVCKFGSK